MRLCLDSFVPPLNRITQGAAKWVRDLGFEVIGVDLETAMNVDIDTCSSVRDLLASEGISIGQVWSVGTSLVRPDPAESEAHLQLLLDRIPLASACGCRVLLTEAGGFHPANPWYPHPDNHSDCAMNRLVAALKRIAPVAADYGVVIAPEMSLMTILSSVDRTAAIMSEVDHPGVGVNLDVANIMDPLSLHDSGAFIDQAFDRLADRVVNVHAKDSEAKPVPLIVHLAECPAGQGSLNYDRLLRRTAELPEWTCLVIEHLEDYGQVEEVRRYLMEKAVSAGVGFWR